jgi:type IV pilus assembly protein PilC
MPQFQWEGVGRDGKAQKGVREGASQAAVIQWLRQNQIRPRKVLAKNAASKKKPGRGMGGRVKEKEIVIFARQFATMIDAGLPIVQCLEILVAQQENANFRRVLFEVKQEVESGSTLAESFKKHPKAFDDLFVNLISAGEVGGILDTILLRLAAYLEKVMKLKGKVKSAMVYPAVIVVVSIAVVTILLGFVIPVFENMFREMGNAELPGPTRVVINLSNAFKAYWYIFFGVLGAMVFAYFQIAKTPKGRLAIDKITLQLPVFGPLLRKVAVARFTRTLGTMLSSGVPILDALLIVGKTAGNKVIENAIMLTRTSISEGRTIVEPLSETKVFPAMVVQMIGVGEATGAMDAMLSKIADFYDDEVDSAVDALTSLIEPVMMVVLGGVIGGMVVAMYMPIFKMAGSINTN